ncbi:MAG: hypothetical protein A2603_15095 [Bdellovibrionales bacterium RIFOXYD1_FULL_55_31]|nr:MAG: hypothetical protein A2603_15095 [Bdellovibrionales bacterium RIFOXYD1_FULL_55_31]
MQPGRPVKLLLNRVRNRWHSGGVVAYKLFMTRRWEWGTFALLYIAVFCGILFSFLLQQVQPKWDAVQEFYPAFSYFADSIREGRFPFWDPFTNCGYPFFAEPHQPTLNPIALVIALLIKKNSFGFILYYLIHWCLAGLGMFALVRRMKGIPSGAFVAALSFAFSGFFVGNAEHTPFIIHAAWIPFIFASADKGIEEHNWGYLLVSGSLLGISALGGYPPLVAFTGLALALWLYLRFPGEWKRTTLGLALVAVISLVIWSPILQAFLSEGATHSERMTAIEPQRANFSDPFSLTALFTLVFPFFTFTGYQWLGADTSMTNGYAGLLTIPLVIYWALNGTKEDARRNRWWLFAFVGVMFWISLGGAFGLRSALYYLFPPLKFVRYSAIFRLYWLLGLALAAGLSWSLIASEQVHFERFRGRVRRCLVVIVVSALILMRGFLWAHGSHASPLNLYLPAMLLLPLAVVFFGRVKTLRNPVALSLGLMLFVSDAALHTFVNQGTVMEPNTSMRQVELEHVPSNTPAAASVLEQEPGPRLPARFFGLMNAQQINKRPTTLGYIAMQVRDYDEKLVTSGYAKVLESGRRFWLVPGAPQARGGTGDFADFKGATLSANEVLAQLSNLPAGAAVPAYHAEDYAARFVNYGAVIPGSFGAVSIRKYAPEQVLLNVDVPGTAPALLASSERWGNSWGVSIDGVPAKKLLTNLFFRGVQVPPGVHVVEWTYRPRYWNVLVWTSVLMAVGSLVAGWALARRGALRLFR